MNIDKIYKSIICFFFIVSSCLNARTLELNSRSRLVARINQSYLAIVQFYGCQANHECQKQDYKMMKSRFNAVSQNSKFRQAGVDFIIMNCSSDFSVAQAFGVSSFPAIQLFMNGMPLPGASLQGFVNEFDINALIENYLGNEINNVLCQKQEDYERKQEMQLAAWAAWAPYWYCNYGCYRPWGWGFGCGWGRGCCW